MKLPLAITKVGPSILSCFNLRALENLDSFSQNVPTTQAPFLLAAVQAPNAMSLLVSNTNPLSLIVVVAAGAAASSRLLSMFLGKFPSLLQPVWLLSFFVNLAISTRSFLLCRSSFDGALMSSIKCLPWFWWLIFVVDIVVVANFKASTSRLAKEKLGSLTENWVQANFWHAFMFLSFQSGSPPQLQILTAIIATAYRFNFGRLINLQKESPFIKNGFVMFVLIQTLWIAQTVLKLCLAYVTDRKWRDMILNATIALFVGFVYVLKELVKDTDMVERDTPKSMLERFPSGDMIADIVPNIM